MKTSLFLLALLTVIALPPGAACAEKANLTADQLLETATHVVTGKAVKIYERGSRDGNWRYTHYVAEIAIDALEKGEGLQKGGLVYVRYWRRGWTGAMPPASTSGHRGLPSEGDRMRVYLARNAHDGFGETKDGGFNVIGANGFEKLEAATE